MAKHVHGSVETGGKEDTFAGFVNIVKWAVILIFAVLIFLAIVNG